MISELDLYIAQGIRSPIMFSQRLTRSTTSSLKLIRPFSTTQCLQKTPALADVKPGYGQEFDQRQQRFRDELAKRTREQREKDRMQSKNSFPATAKSSSSSSSSASVSAHDNDHGVLEGKGLGSLSTATGEAARKADEASNPRRPGRFSSLIYGTEEGREMDREIERSFSQVLARGKYVHSIVFHEVKPDKVDEYVELVGGWYPRVASNPENKVHLVGSWRTEVGDCDTFGRNCRLHAS